MAYSRVERRVWADERFRAWDHVKRLAWFYLLTGPCQNRLGCFVLHPMYLAADLEIEPGRADRLLDEFSAEGRIARDPATHLVLVRRHLKHSVLKNQNTVTAAMRELEELPYSEPIYRALLSALEQFGKPFYEPLTLAVRSRIDQRAAEPEETVDIEGHPNSSPNSSGNSRANPEPEPEPDTDTERDAATARTREEARRKYLREVVKAANGGMKANPEIGEQFTPIATGHASRTDAEAWFDQGVPLETAVREVHAAAVAWRPDGRRKQISSLNYFTNRVLEAHEVEQIDGRSGDSDGVDGRGGSGPTRGEATGGGKYGTVLSGAGG